MWTQADIRREIEAEESIEASHRLAPPDDMSAGEFLTQESCTPLSHRDIQLGQPPGSCEGDTETRPLISRDSLKQG